MLRRFILRRNIKLVHIVVFVVILLMVNFYYMSSNDGKKNPQNSASKNSKLEKKYQRSISDETLKFRQKRYDDYQQRRSSSGPGELGVAVRLSGEEKKKADSLFEKEAFNIVASDKISFERSVKDTRDSGCSALKYPSELPTASVIIIFHNEAWSPLLRTVYSVVNRSPPQYLHEVILLDDFSDRAGLGEELDKYVNSTWPDGVVRIVRTKERSGLIRARLAGARAATGDVIVFLDSHCECNTGWLEPMLARIAEKHTAVVCPEIDVISAKDLSYGGVGSRSVGGFWWSLHFSWRPIPRREDERRKRSTDPIRLEPLLWAIDKNNHTVVCPMIDHIDAQTLEYSGNGGVAAGGFTWSLHFTWEDVPTNWKRGASTDPIKSPTMAGGLFAADRNYFFEIGGYDPGMDVWGGENLELSFRVWMCGGSLEFMPCSRVGHIFRASHPYTFPGNKDTHGLNSKRLADVWMDDYKRLFYMHRHELQTADAGDISERVALREKLQCHSFKWFLDNVYPEKFIPDENVQAYGMLKNPLSSICLDTMGKDEKTPFNIGVFSCQGGASANQVFSLSHKGELRREEGCLDSRGQEGGKVKLQNCHGMRGNQGWKHDRAKGTIAHEASGKCLDKAAIPNGGEVILRSCSGAASQQWEFEHYLTS